MRIRLGASCLIAAVVVASASAQPSSRQPPSKRPASRPATQPASQPVDYYSEPTDAFFERAEVQQPIDRANVDDALLAAAIFHETNRIRATFDLPALRHSAKLDAAAAMHSRDMIEGEFFAHENPKDETKRTPLDRARLCDYEPRYIAENIATAFLIQYESGASAYRVRGGVSYEPRGLLIPPHTYASFARKLVDDWMHSPPHRKDILAKEPIELGTAGVLEAAKSADPLVKFYCAQEFGTPRGRR